MQNKITAFILVVLAALYYLWRVDDYFCKMNEAYENAKLQTIHVPPSPVNPELEGKLLLIHADSLTPYSLLKDADFNIEHTNALKLKRVTEYCQWEEVCKYGEGCEYYITWKATREKSLSNLFRWSYHNRTRDPYPTTEWTSSALLGEYIIQEEVIQNQLYSFSHFVPENFTVPQNFYRIGLGYFFSPYSGDIKEVESANRTSIRLAEKWYWQDYGQLSNYLQNCKAGDILIHYEALTINEVTVVAQQMDDKGTLGYFTAKNGERIAFVKSGKHSTEIVATERVAMRKIVAKGIILVGAFLLLLSVQVACRDDVQ